jgi:hypothetical protein
MSQRFTLESLYARRKAALQLLQLHAQDVKPLKPKKEREVGGGGGRVAMDTTFNVEGEGEI